MARKRSALIADLDFDPAPPIELQPMISQAGQSQFETQMSVSSKRYKLDLVGTMLENIDNDGSASMSQFPPGDTQTTIVFEKPRISPDFESEDEDEDERAKTTDTQDSMHEADTQLLRSPSRSARSTSASGISNLGSYEDEDSEGSKGDARVDVQSISHGSQCSTCDSSSSRSSSSSSSSSSGSRASLQPETPAPSDLKSQLQTFLPRLAEANALLPATQLEAQDFLITDMNQSPVGSDGENTGENSAPQDQSGPYIEMDLSLGVLEETTAGPGKDGITLRATPEYSDDSDIISSSSASSNELEDVDESSSGEQDEKLEPAPGQVDPQEQLRPRRARKLEGGPDEPIEYKGKRKGKISIMGRLMNLKGTRMR